MTGAPDMNTVTPAERRRYSALGSVVLSPDFYLSLIIGPAAALGVAFSGNIRSALDGHLMAIAGISAGIAGLVLASLSVLLGIMPSSYRRFVRKTKGGIRDLILPFRWVIIVAALASAWSALGSNLALIVDGCPWLAYGLAAFSYFLFLWALFGCIQLTGQVATHLENIDKVSEQEERRDNVKARNRASSSGIESPSGGPAHED